MSLRGATLNWILLGATALGQPLFECQLLGTFPVLPLIDCEGVGASATAGGNPLPTVENIANCGQPGPGGAQYAFLPANGNANGGGPSPAIGGPIGRPLAGVENELRIPIPSSALSVSFRWEFFDGEVAFGFAVPYNDAFTVEVVDPATGLAVGPPLVYIDSATFQGFGSTPASIGPCPNTGPTAGGVQELGAPTGVSNGPQICSCALPLLPAGAYLSVVCLNGADNAFTSAATIDDFIFSNNPPCTFSITQPLGAGSISVAISYCTPGAAYLMPVTLISGGAFPNGWCLGVDIPLGALVAEISFGVPFIGNLDGTGSSLFAVPAGIPSGIPIFAGCGLFTPGLTTIFTPVSLVTL
jgi:hypothetical protein